MYSSVWRKIRAANFLGRFLSSTLWLYCTRHLLAMRLAQIKYSHNQKVYIKGTLTVERSHLTAATFPSFADICLLQLANHLLARDNLMTSAETAITHQYYPESSATSGLTPRCLWSRHHRMLIQALFVAFFQLHISDPNQRGTSRKGSP